ncbi:MAG: repressor LexA [Ignavibacteria bacterium]|nr:MAG: repressor LexA [Ignavibacteria bacterium]KAF0162478.1 MAG: repressor LexA [Ignavibacteria bacterium]
MTKKNLTNTQKIILEFLIERKEKHQLPPTLADIALHFGYKNRATVQQHLHALEKKNYIKRNPKISRGIELLLEDKIFVSRPIIGEVAAGNPLTIYPSAIDSIDLPKIARLPKDSFLLRVRGNSLVDVNIINGDVVIVNPNLEPKNGNVVASVLEDAALVKRFYKTENGIELHSENKEYEPIIIDPIRTSFKIVGVVVGIYRSMIH